MNKSIVVFLPVLGSVLLWAADQPKIPPMPSAVTSNAVASLRNGIEIYSMMGIGTKRTWDDVSNKMYILRLSSGKWMEGKSVPGVAGRLGSSGIGVKGQIFVFGGYVIDGQGNELTVSDVTARPTSPCPWIVR
jgi:predicted sugar kinase